MKSGIGKAVAATAAASMAFDVPLPALADELVVAEQTEALPYEQAELDAAVRDFVSSIKGESAAEDPGDLPPFFVNEGFAPETYDANAAQGHRRPERELPR